jgi:Tol biopolymer transport system component
MKMMQWLPQTDIKNRTRAGFVPLIVWAWFLMVAVFSITGETVSVAATPCTLDRATGTTIDPTPFLTNGYSMRWNIPTNRLAYMQPGADGYYQVWTMRPDGTGRKLLTDNRPGWPVKHRGAVYWHPSGRYLLFIAQKPEWTSKTLFGVPDYEALPGFGRHDDLWLATPDGSKCWQLTHDPGTKQQGILLPVFSPDGKKIAWSARQPDATYALQIAEFFDTPQPHLGTITTYRPGGKAYYEPGSFTSDSKSLAYTSDQGTHSFWKSQIYRLDLATGVGTRLTNDDAYNEHPTVIRTPTGDWIVYMSDKGVNRFPGHLMLGTDWWAMKLDGTAVKRLTTMNIKRPDNSENAGIMQVACTVAVSPNGQFMLGDIQDSLVKQTGMVKIIRFTAP